MVDVAAEGRGCGIVVWVEEGVEVLDVVCDDSGCDVVGGGDVDVVGVEAEEGAGLMGVGSWGERGGVGGGYQHSSCQSGRREERHG